MSPRLDGKVALVTGGGTGIGRGVATAFVAAGARVVVSGRRAEPLRETVEELGGEEHARAITADVTRPGDRNGLLRDTIDAFGGLDILVNNAGASAAHALEAVSDSDWQVDFDLKVMAAVRLCREAIPHMKARGGGSIVQASIGGGKAPKGGQLPTSLTRRRFPPGPARR